MSLRPIADVSCRAFEQIEPGEEGVLLRFVVGEDAAPRTMPQEEIEAELGDPLARLLLSGHFPATAEELLAGIDSIAPEDDPLRQQRTFFLGEESQVLPIDNLDSANTGLRFLVARGLTSQGADLLISASHPRQGLVEVMGWDARNDGFNYYRTVNGTARTWVWAGNSRHALHQPTMGKGPFETHTAGNFIMKELRFPWVHWNSFAANIFPSVFSDGDIRRDHPWFTSKDGADVCELDIAMPSIRRWTAVRFARAQAGDEAFDDPARFLLQVLTTPTINLITTGRSTPLADGRPLDLPASFFVDIHALTETLGLAAPVPFSVAATTYTSSLEKFGFALRMDGFERKGDTHFAFVVPERAFEDTEVVKKALEVGLLSDRLAAALLMVDFSNPVFSARRAALLKHVPEGLSMRDLAGFADELVERILAAAETSGDNSPEGEFAVRWGVGDAWRETFNGVLNGYYAAVAGQLRTEAGFDAYVRLSETRRDQVRKRTRLAEFPLLFPQNNIEPTQRFMRPDGTVLETDEPVV